jgi:hypothetical protein
MKQDSKKNMLSDENEKNNEKKDLSQYKLTR